MIIVSIKKLFSVDEAKVVLIGMKENSDEDTPIIYKPLSIFEDGSYEWRGYSEDEIEAFEGEIYESEIYSRVENFKVKVSADIDAGIEGTTLEEAETIYKLVEEKVQNSQY